MSDEKFPATTVKDLPVDLKSTMGMLFQDEHGGIWVLQEAGKRNAIAITGNCSGCTTTIRNHWTHFHWSDLGSRLPSSRVAGEGSFPELKHLSSEDLCDRFSELGVDFYTKEETPASVWIRLSLLFAVIVWILMFIGLPIVFLFTGRWGYSFSEKNRLYNWFQALFP